MSVSHAYFYSFWIIFTFQCSLTAVLDIITQDSERLLLHIICFVRFLPLHVSLYESKNKFQPEIVYFSQFWFVEQYKFSIFYLAFNTNLCFNKNRLENLRFFHPEVEFFTKPMSILPVIFIGKVGKTFYFMMFFSDFMTRIK